MKKTLVGMFAVSAVASTANAAVVLDQIGTQGDGWLVGTSTYASQDFQAQYDQYDTVAMDDFTMPYDGTVTSIEAVVGGWNGFGGAAELLEYHVAIYASPAAAATGLISGAFAYLGVVAPDSYVVDFEGTGDLVQFNTAFALTAGDWWVGVFPVNDFGGLDAGQTGIRGSSQGNLNGYQANPGGGFGFPGGYQQIDPASNLAYRVHAVPAPGALALLGLAGLIGRRRR